MKIPTAIIGSAFLFVLFGISSLSAATEVVNNFGQGNWYSWDTRNSSGTNLVGTNDTSPAWPNWASTNSTADDAAIQNQIKFMGEGQVVGDAGDVGNPPAASPIGSLNGLGYVRLDGTGQNQGKSDLSYVNPAGIAAASALLDPNFGVSYRYYIDPETTFRTLGLNISLTNNTQSNLYTFAYVDPNAMGGVWNTSMVAANSGLFSLFANGSSAEGGATKTLTAWSTDPTYGAAIFGGSETVFRMGFNLGSFQRNNLQYLDWMQTNLLNGGDTIDFQAVPEPSTWAAAALAAIGVAGSCYRRLALKRI